MRSRVSPSSPHSRNCSLARLFRNVVFLVVIPAGNLLFAPQLQHIRVPPTASRLPYSRRWPPALDAEDPHLPFPCAPSRSHAQQIAPAPPSDPRAHRTENSSAQESVRSPANHA